MTTLIDGRAGGLDAYFRPGNTFAVAFTWPAGGLAGRTFVATLDAANLAVSITGDVLTVTASEAQTAAAAAAGTFTLTETSSGLTQDIVAGRWVPSTQPGTPTSLAVTVSDGPLPVQVTVVPVASPSPSQYVVVPARWGIQWRQARGEAGTRQVRVHFWGGSVTEGPPGASDPETTSWRGLVGAALRAKYGDGGSGYLHIGRATSTGTWTSHIGMGGTEHRATAAASKEWTGLRGTTIRILARQGLTGSWRYQIDGGGFTTVTPPTGFGVEPSDTVVTGLADTPHTVRVEWVSGTVGIHGVEASRPTGIVTAGCAVGGRAMTQYGKWIERQMTIGVTNTSGTITSTAPGAFTPDMVGRYVSSPTGGLGITADHQITAVASATSATISPVSTLTNAALLVDLHRNPGSQSAVGDRTTTPSLGSSLGRADLLIIGCGLNDMAMSGATPASMAEGMSRLMKSYMQGNDQTFAPDVVILSEHQAAFSDLLGSGLAMAGTAAAIAAGIGAAFCDVWSLGHRSHKFWSDLGYMFDTVHPNDTGMQQYASLVTPLLTGA